MALSKKKKKKNSGSTNGMSFGLAVCLINGKWESVQETCINTVIFCFFTHWRFSFQPKSLTKKATARI